MGGKDDEKFMHPLFPRVHVRDTEKGWPKAPPRNKMALCEQLTVSSEKFDHGNFCSANGNANDLRFTIQQVPPSTPVRVSGEGNVQQPDAASVISFSSRHVLRKRVDDGDDDEYLVPASGRGNADMVHCESNAKTDAGYRDDETVNHAEILRVLDNGVIPEKRSKEPIALDEDDGDDDDDYDNNTAVSDTSMVDSASGQDISVNDVVEAIGQKRYWKAKNAISNQQRLFATQVFELHRLIKVQRLIAESPHLLFDDRASPGKSSPKHKHLAPGFVVKPLPRYVRFKDDTQKANHNHHMEGSAENSPGVSLPLSRVQNVDFPSNPHHQPPNPSPATTAATESRCCFQQPWLIPVMSPSEGLIYKPYLSPPGFAWGCGGCGSNNLTSMAFGFPAAPRQQGICSVPIAHPMFSYFPPYGLPVPDPATCSGPYMDQRMQPNPPSSLVQSSNLTGTETASVFQDRGSCNLPTRVNATAPEVSTADASLMEARPQGEDDSVLALNSRDSDETTVARPGRVIRAVPRNPRLATESAAQIFRSIQEERKQF